MLATIRCFILTQVDRQLQEKGNAATNPPLMPEVPQPDDPHLACPAWPGISLGSLAISTLAAKKIQRITNISCVIFCMAGNHWQVGGRWKLEFWLPVNMSLQLGDSWVLALLAFYQTFISYIIIFQFLAEWVNLFATLELTPWS